MTEAKKEDHRAEIVDKVSTWLTEDHTFELVPDHNAFSNIVITIGVFNINIIVKKDKFDSLLIVSSIGLTPEDQKVFAYLKPNKQKEFLRNCETRLLQNEVGYQFEPDKSNVQKIGISKILFNDGLTKQSFFNGILTIARTLSLVNLEYQKLRNTG